MKSDPLSVARACYQAYEDKDRTKIESLLADDFRFTSPLDNALDRAAYLKICWPNSERQRQFEYIHQVAHGDRAFVIYEAVTDDGKRFRNNEVLTVRDGKIVAVEVYFGWSVPHDVPDGQHRDP
jgi:ketosteroid isomerase-like protein